jgi:protein-disulfide isomerase
MKRYLPFVIIILVGAGAVTSGALLYRAKRSELAAINEPAGSGTAKTGSAGAKPPHIRGEADARVTLEEFGDFQCPPCEMMAPALAKIEHDYADKLRVVFRNFPLAMHNHARLAAQAAEAAGMQGRFWEMHDALYRNRPVWAAKGDDVQDLFIEYARSIGLDVERFKRDIETEPVKERVNADQQRGTSMGVSSTPTIFINNIMIPPASFAEPALRAAIDNVISGKPPVPPASPTPAAPATTLPVPTP